MSLPENNSEKDLWSLLQQGNMYAYELFFRRYYVSLCGFATRYVQEPDAAEEIVQGIFVKLWENRSRIFIETSLKSYLFRTTYNKCHNHLSHARVKSKYLSMALEAYARNEAIHDPVYDSLAYKELNDKITEAIEKLPSECKRIFKMSRFDGMKYAEIAAQLNISVKTIETQISRALSRLRKELKEWIRE